MAELDYFLEDKIISKNLKKLKGQIYKSEYPVTSKTKFRWTIDKNFVEDCFCYDYLLAYKFDEINDSKLMRDFKYFEIGAMAIMNGKIEETSIEVIYNKLKKLNSGHHKVVSYDDKVLLNLLEVYDLISQRNFPLNQENFELFIHILFRNLVYDLDIPRSYMRNEKTKLPIKNYLDNRLINSELENFWKTLENDNKDNKADFTSITKAFLLGIEMGYLSPYDRFNLIIMSFVAKWYLFQLDGATRSIYFNLLNLLDYQEFIKTIDLSLKTFNLDNYLKLMRDYCQRELRFAKRAEWIIGYGKTHHELSLELKKYQNIFYLDLFMGYGDKKFSSTTILRKYSKSALKLDKQTIQSKLDLFKSFKILEQDEKTQMYYINELNFKTCAMIFKD